MGRVVEDEVKTYRGSNNIELVGHSKHIGFYSEENGKPERDKETFTGKRSDYYIGQHYVQTRVELEYW